ncbi:MAG: cytochrome C [Candidatus Thiodiazotropha sp.]|jgi:hypothetical protein
MKMNMVLFVVPLTVIMLIGTGLVLADRDEHEAHEKHERGFLSHWFKPQHMAFNTEQSKRYQEECGSCHFPFQPGFLPAKSWQEIMAGLSEHFGENAELSDEDTQNIAAYLDANAAGNIDREIPNKVMWSLRYKPNPKRITETAFFRHEHRKIPVSVLNNKGEKISFANCDSCHTRAMQGSFNEHEIRIPGVGRWED